VIDTSAVSLIGQETSERSGGTSSRYRISLKFRHQHFKRRVHGHTPRSVQYLSYKMHARIFLTMLISQSAMTARSGRSAARASEKHSRRDFARNFGSAFRANASAFSDELREIKCKSSGWGFESRRKIKSLLQICCQVCSDKCRYNTRFDKCWIFDKESLASL